MPNTRLTWIVCLVIGLIAGLLVLTLEWSKISNRVLGRNASIEGSIIFTALKPDPDDQGNVHIFYREYNTNQDFKDTGILVPLADNQSWQWEDAVQGKNYEVYAALVIEGETIKKSEIVTVTAPAYNTDLHLAVRWRDLPQSVVDISQLPVSGTVTVNGVIPSGSRLEMYALPAGQTPQNGQYGQLVQTVQNPTASTAWQWNQAVPLTSYVFSAVFKSASGQILDVADETVVAESADSNVNFIINSTAPVPTPVSTPAPTPQATPAPGQPTPSPTPAAGQSQISGVVTLNGPMDNNSSLLLLWRQPGQSEYQVVNRYTDPNHDGQLWNWTGAQAGQTYEISAALQVNGNNTSVAPQSQIVTAPATNVNFTLNTNFLVPTPGGTPTLQTCLNRSGNTWTAQIVLPQVQGAGNYWLQVGSAQGQSDLFSGKVAAGSGPTIFNVGGAQNAKQYFAQFAFSDCVNCASSNNNFSPFSATRAFTCE